MAGNQQLPTVISFGPFEADLQTQELRKQGVRLRLPGQSFQILKMLLMRSGELVTREELLKELWPSETYVDFDHGVNAAVNRLREVLGDDADNPRFIETLPRRGYRFIGPTARAEQNDPEKLAEYSEAHVSHRFLLKTGLTVASLAAIAGVVAFWLRPILPPPPRVVRYGQLTNDGLVKDTSCQWKFDLVTDGPRVYFPEFKSALLQVSATGGDAVSIPTPFECVNVLDISPDRTELLLFHFGQGMQLEQPLWASVGPQRRPTKAG